jgi:FAD/FMN-containing dehydrogenase
MSSADALARPEPPAELVAALSEACGAEALLTDPADLVRYERGWRYGVGRAALVVRPRSSDEVAAVLRLCDQRGQRVHIAGANTGLVGASTPDRTGEQVVLSLERLDRIVQIDPAGRTATVEAGVTLGTLNQALAPHGLCFPIDLGADPQIGGMIATNTGGSRLLAHGDVRHNLLGLEVVLPDGERWSGLSGLRKDNTGLDWKQLFVGTSGAYGVITAAVLELAPLPRQRSAAWVAAGDGEALVQLLSALERDTGGHLSAFEVLSREALEATLAHGANLRRPFAGQAPRYAALLECSSTLAPERLDLEALLTDACGRFLEQHPEAAIEDVLLVRPEEGWHLRHQVSESLAQRGRVIAMDLSVPRARLPAFSAAARRLVAEEFPGLVPHDFGHWGDGGTHFNLVYDPLEQAGRAGPGFDAERLRRAVLERVYRLCVEEFGGSFSAEHGLGPHNQAFAERHRPRHQRELEARLSALLDPRGRLRRGDDGPAR